MGQLGTSINKSKINSEMTKNSFNVTWVFIDYLKWFKWQHLRTKFHVRSGQFVTHLDTVLINFDVKENELRQLKFQTPSYQKEWGSSIFTFLTLRVLPWLQERKNETIKLTSPPFHVWKEVIIVLYTADQARPIMMEGWTEPFLCAHICALSCPCRSGHSELKAWKLRKLS